MRYLFAFIVAFFSCVSGFSIAADYHPTRLVVKTRPTAVAKRTALATILNAKRLEPLVKGTAHAADSDPLSRIFVAEFADTASCNAAERILSLDPEIEYVERDYYQQMFADPLESNQWGLANTGQEFLGIRRVPGSENDSLLLFRGTSGADIHRGQVESAPTDRSRVRVAIIDTGVDYLHPDLQANIWRNRAEAEGIPGADDDFNGYIDDVFGFDFSGDAANVISISPDPDPMDTIGHGTHVAGIVGAVTDNGLGIVGVAPNVELMCLKIFPNALATASSQAIIYAADHGARVINASWGSPFYSSILVEAFEYAIARGVIFVAAAGNSGTSTPFFPARFDRALTVGATNANDRVTTFSTFGDWLDVCAPGENILSLRAARTDLYAGQGEPNIRIIEDEYYLADGTSMAAPHVAGAAAFLLSVAPGLSPDSVQSLLMASADKISIPNGNPQSAFSPYAGWGRINLERAVAFLSGEYVELESPRPNELLSGAIEIRGSAVAAAGSFVLEARPASLGEWIEIASGPAAQVRQVLAQWDSSPFDGLTFLRLKTDESVVFTMAVRLANRRVVELITPTENDTVYSVAAVVGSASSPTFHSWRLTYAPESNPKQETLIRFAREIAYREEIAEWTVGQIPSGPGFLMLTLTDGDGETKVTRRIVVKSTLVAGYPRNAGAHLHLTSVVGNLDDDPAPEIVTGTRSGVLVNHFDENRLELIPAEGSDSHESSPALHDFNGDGRDEIVTVTTSGITIIDASGQPLPGWPKRVLTGVQFNAYPTPLVTDIDGDGGMEILLVNIGGEIYCWRESGISFFRSSGGLFARIGDDGRYRNYGGSVPSYIFAFDFDQDGYQDVGVLYTAVGGQGGVFMYSGKNGAPLYRDRGAQVFDSDGIFGGVLADFDNDAVPEIALATWYSGNLAMAVHVIEADGSPLSGWPKLFPDRTNWLTPFPAVADLDRDSIPELICVFSALDGGEVFVWKGDGSPFLASEFGRNDGFLARTINAISSPLVLDVDNDGTLEIVARGGSLLFGKPERILAWELDGTETPGWPLYTFADPSRVLYSPFTPVAGDFDSDGLLELYISSSDNLVYAWDLPTVASDSAIAWGTFLGNKRNTGILPSLARPQSPPTPALPTNFRLGQNYPNPFNQSTSIEVDVTADAFVSLEILNLLGQKIAVIVNRLVAAGFHRFDWDGRDQRGREVASGVYFYRLRIGDYTETRRMVLLR